MKKIEYKLIENKNFPNERDLYNTHYLHLKNVRFDGVEDGESALKESSNIKIEDTFFNLRYPLWHVDNLEVKNSKFTELSRAALWYTNNILIEDSFLDGIKALRECKNINLKRIEATSPEILWKCKNIELVDSSITSEYAFLLSKNIKIRNLKFSGKYSFQYCKNVEIEDSYLDTKDCFWHTENVVIRNSTVQGEYLAWYSKNLTFIDCRIIGTQPFCYTKNLKLINCTMEDCDLAFEYSTVKGDIHSVIDSIKNPKGGAISCVGVKELIYTKDSKIKPKLKINYIK